MGSKKNVYIILVILEEKDVKKSEKMVCDVCGKTLSSLRSVRRHTGGSTCIQPVFKCGECGKHFLEVMI